VCLCLCLRLCLRLCLCLCLCLRLCLCLCTHMRAFVLKYMCIFFTCEHARARVLLCDIHCYPGTLSSFCRCVQKSNINGTEPHAHAHVTYRAATALTFRYYVLECIPAHYYKYIFPPCHIHFHVQPRATDFRKSVRKSKNRIYMQQNSRRKCTCTRYISCCHCSNVSVCTCWI